MPSLKDLKIRINSVKSTRKITKAMQMVAAAKLRRAQEAVEAGRPYAERMTQVLGNIAAAAKDSPQAPALLAGVGKEDTHLLIVATAERGLCGGFNSSIAKLARLKADELLAQGKTVKILCVGKKGREQLKRTHGRLFVEDQIDFQGVRRIGYEHALQVSDRVLTMFAAGEFDVCTLFFGEFKSVMAQIPTANQIIPATFDGNDDASGTSAFYEYEPGEDEILTDLLPRNVTVQIFRALLENGASEQGARMSAMDSATRNAGDMIDKLTLQYNRSRQAAITSELIEIISGAEAL